ncbi:MAG TPA: OmpA family protein [Planctomycetota bacterium]|jgi:ABC-type nitrate/sulfonate/bicarbonate transport system substrate-binding protein
MDEEIGKPKAPFYVAVGLIILALMAFAAWRMDLIAPKGKGPDMPKLSDEELKKLKTPTEAADNAAPTTVKEYKYVAAEKLPPVTGVARYAKLENETVKFALNVWAGWAPIVYANQGFKPKKEWTTPDGKKFKIELVLIDDPVLMRDAYAAGKVHIGWATVDMLPLFMEQLKKDSLMMPRVFQQIDWSNGGDGIVSRANIDSISKLRGKTVVLAQNSPSEYFLLNTLINGGVQPAEVTMKFTGDAFQAAAAFAADKSIAAAVSWAPDIYKLAKIPGNKLLVSTGDANHLIADVWFARADFAKENPGIIEGIVRGILDAVEELEPQEKKQQVAKYMAEGYNLPEPDALGMLGDAHWTNYRENYEFFLNANNPTNFERVWDNSYFLYRSIRKITTEKIAFDQVADFSVIQKLGSEPKYANSVNKYKTEFAAKSVTAIKAEAGEILTKTVVVHFPPNSFDLQAKITRNVGGKMVEEAYDPNVDFVVKDIAGMAGQFGAARIVIEGHTDASMKGVVPFAGVKELSSQRAAAVKDALLKKFPSIPANQISTEGMGWNVPADPTQPNDHVKNRRVEVKVFPMEQQQ